MNFANLFPCVAFRIYNIPPFPDFEQVAIPELGGYCSNQKMVVKVTKC